MVSDTNFGNSDDYAHSKLSILISSNIAYSPYKDFQAKYSIFINVLRMFKVLQFSVFK